MDPRNRRDYAPSLMKSLAAIVVFVTTLFINAIVFAQGSPAAAPAADTQPASVGAKAVEATKQTVDTAEQWIETAIKYEGSTLSDGTYRNALNKAGGYQNHHRVYDRADDTCPSCGKCQIVRIVQAQRATFFCPRCQRKRV